MQKNEVTLCKAETATARKQTSRGRLSISLLGLAIAGLILSSCVTYIEAKRYGTYTYKGVDYDVYTATKHNEEDLSENRGVRILVPKGTPLSKIEKITPIAVCSVHTSNTRCNKEFGREIDRAFQTEEESSSGGGMY